MTTKEVTELLQKHKEYKKLLINWHSSYSHNIFSQIKLNYYNYLFVPRNPILKNKKNMNKCTNKQYSIITNMTIKILILHRHEIRCPIISILR